MPGGPIRWELEPKPGGGTRRIARLTPADELAYARAVARVARSVERSRGPATFANGVARVGPAGIAIRAWSPQRARWRRRAARLLADASVVLVTDIRDCYASIRPDVVGARLRGCGAPSDAVDPILRCLRLFEALGVDGLPVGPAASAVLAEAVLVAGDQALDAAGALYVRWVDDVAVFATERGTGTAALTELHRAWASLGLVAHDGKTATLDAIEGWPRSVAMSTSAVTAVR